ncbi:MAG TPA: DUF4352 domain-containing protein [Bryobacteraceae bacterium]|nr:DUF4352 domain-containing protein [Bryobacteraceae bacterium]
MLNKKAVSKAGCVIATASLLAALLLIAGCNRTKTLTSLGTFPMGERVQVGPLTYTVLETEWRTQMGEGFQGKLPSNRFLVVKLAISNGGGGHVAVPIMSIEDAGGHSYTEITEGTENVSEWLGLLRNMAPMQSDRGIVIFDAPVAAYKLRVSDGGEIGAEKTALIDLPIHIQ